MTGESLEKFKTVQATFEKRLNAIEFDVVNTKNDVETDKNKVDP
jgi:hypothetical protein